MFSSNERDRLARLWGELIDGTRKIESFAYGQQEWSMVVTRGAKSGALRERDVEVLERALLSGDRKHVAVDVGLSCSSIAVIMQSCFQFMGLSCLPSRIPGLLVVAAHAHHRQTAVPRLAPGNHAEGPSSETIRVARPDLELSAWLAPAEHAVIHLLIEGMTYAEMASARQTSVRTVANQVAAGFRRLDVSGRAELLCLLAEWGLKRPPRPTQRPSVVISEARRGIPQGRRRTQRAASGPHCLSPILAT